jgi:hypothetical protein
MTVPEHSAGTLQERGFNHVMAPGRASERLLFRLLFQPQGRGAGRQASVERVTHRPRSPTARRLRVCGRAGLASLRCGMPIAPAWVGAWTWSEHGDWCPAGQAGETT